MKRQEDLFTNNSFDMTPVGPEATVHDILKAKGRRGASTFASRTLAEIGRRAPVDILAGPRGGRIIATAADVAEATGALGAETTAAGHVYSGWCMLGLPYRRPKGEKDQIWRITTDYADITIQSGTISRDGGEMEYSGVPFGSYARMALIALQSEALEQCSRDIELGETAYDALKRLGLPDGGKVAESALAQIEKLARCHVSFRIGSELKGLQIRLLLGSGVVMDLSRDQAGDQGTEQGFAAPASVVHELEEAEVERQLVLRDAAVRAQPGAQQGPESFQGIDVDLAETVPVLVAGILASGVADRLVPVAPSRQARIDGILVRVDESA